MDTLLSRAAVPQPFKDVITQYAEAAVTLVKEMESVVLRYTQKKELIEMVDRSVRDAQVARLQSFVDLFTELSESPRQMVAASNFRDYVNQAFGKEPEKPREQDLERGR